MLGQACSSPQFLHALAKLSYSSTLVSPLKGDPRHPFYYLPEVVLELLLGSWEVQPSTSQEEEEKQV